MCRTFLLDVVETECNSTIQNSVIQERIFAALEADDVKKLHQLIADINSFNRKSLRRTITRDLSSPLLNLAGLVQTDVSDLSVCSGSSKQEQSVSADVDSCTDQHMQPNDDSCTVSTNVLQGGSPDQANDDSQIYCHNESHADSDDKSHADSHDKSHTDSDDKSHSDSDDKSHADCYDKSRVDTHSEEDESSGVRTEASFEDLPECDYHLNISDFRREV